MHLNKDLRSNPIVLFSFLLMVLSAPLQAEQIYPNDSNEFSSDNNNLINWENVKVEEIVSEPNAYFTHARNFIKFSMKNYNSLPADLSGSWGFQTFIDSDNDPNTGFQYSNVFGADYIFEGKILHKYLGNGTDWNWKPLTTNYGSGIDGFDITHGFADYIIGKPESFRFILKGVNEAIGGTEIDLYPNKANDELADDEERYFTYFLQTSIQGNNPPVSNRQEFTVNINESVTFTLDGEDIDNDPLSIVPWDRNNLEGQFEVLSEADLLVRFTPNNNFTGSTFFAYRLSDGITESAVTSVTFKVQESRGVLSNPVESIVIDGDAEDWASTTPFRDNSPNSQSKISWKNASVAHSDDTIYLRYENINDIASFNGENYLSWGWQTYFDTDTDNSTGFYGYDEENAGADYLLEGTTLYKYVGNGVSWDWLAVGNADFAFSEKTVELSFAKSLLSLNQANIRVEFFGNNNAYEENNRFDYSLHDKYPDSGYFSYSFGILESSSQAMLAIDMEGLARSPEAHNRANNISTIETANETNSGGGSLPINLLLIFCFLLFRIKSMRSEE